MSCRKYAHKFFRSETHKTYPSFGDPRARKVPTSENFSRARREPIYLPFTKAIKSSRGKRHLPSHFAESAHSFRSTERESNCEFRQSLKAEKHANARYYEVFGKARKLFAGIEKSFLIEARSQSIVSLLREVINFVN